MTAPTPGTRRRRLRGAAAAVVLLALTTTACSSLGRTAVGPVLYASEIGGGAGHEGEGVHLVIQVTSPSVLGCHRMGKAANVVENQTLIDMRLYERPGCRGKYTYLATTLSDRRAPRALPWRSYSFVH